LALVAIAGLTASLAVTAPATGTTPGENGRIAFRTFLDADQTTSAIYSLRPDGTGLRRLTHPSAGVQDTQPDWSPLRNRIGFERCAPDAPCAIYTVRPSGRSLTRLTPPCHAAPQTCVDESSIAFMPDGRRVVFTRATGRVRTFPNGEGFIEHSDIVIRDLSGNHAHTVLRPRAFSGDNEQMVASPDGGRLAFQRTNSPLVKPVDGTALFVVKVNGRHLRRITPWALDAGDHPDWSPDGRWILFRSNVSGNFLNSQLFVIHPDGTGLRQVTHVSADTLLLSASFSPDGRRIVYAQSGQGGAPDIFTMNANGGGRRQVTRTPKWDSAPDWGPRR
jgi:Tol biopolymer transport system component